MKVIECKKRDLVKINADYVKDLGYSLIDGMIGEITNADGDKPKMKLGTDFCDDALIGCTDRKRINGHIDIFAKTADVVYDLGYNANVETIVFRAYFHEYQREYNYTIGEFKLYASNSKEELFNKENEIAHERGIDYWVSGDRNNADWVYDVKGSFRFFGVQILNANPTDDIIRLGYIGLYNKEYTEKKKYVINNFGDSLIHNLEPAVITNGNFFVDELMCEIKGSKTFNFKLKSPRVLSNLWVVTVGKLDIKAKGFKLKEEKVLPYGRTQYNFEGCTKKETTALNVTVKGKGFVDGMGVTSKVFKFNVATKNVICDNFYGIGANVLPMNFMPENMETGYNDVYWALESERIKKAKPTVVRMWFQPDWLATNYEDYKNGNYDFQSQKLQSVYKWLDALKEAGSEVEFNFGWKVASYAQDWFSFEGVDKRNSAPKDVDLFAMCCGVTLNELINNRGYDNIKYLTFYNEPDYGQNATHFGDFCVEGCDRKVYWEKILVSCRKEIDKFGLQHVKMWGCETSGSAELQTDWINHFKDIKELDCYTTHKYQHVSGLDLAYDKFIETSAKIKPTIVTECGQCYSEDEYMWTRSHVQLLCDMVRLGASGLFIWCLNSVFISDPSRFAMRNGIDMWDMPQCEGGIDNVRDVYYEWAMLTHYIPNHCKSVESEAIGCSDDARIAAFKAGDDYTVVVELKGNGCEKNIEAKFDKAINKKFYKHVYRRPTCRNGNAIMPPSVAELQVGDKITDTVNGEYQEIVYTTIPPIPQVNLCANEIFVKKGERFLLSAEMIDGEGEIAYELVESTSKAFNLCGKLIYVGEKAKKSDMCAVKAYSINNPKVCSVAIIKVK